MEVVDTHQHLWDLSLFTYSWLENVPALKRSFRLTDYQEATHGVEVRKSVHVEADVGEPHLLGETRHVLSLAERKDNPLAGVVAAARPEKPDFRKSLDAMAGHPNLKGVRRVLHTQPDSLSQSATFSENVRALGEYGLSFDLCVLARQLPIAIRLVRECPGVTFILDHCGVPQVKERVLDPWRADIREIAGFANVWCKVSGLVAYADAVHWTPEDLRPYVEHAIECFGWDRVMFGSDWPVCTLSATLKEWLEALSFLTQGASADERRKLFYENAVRAYRL